jgi:hypothetical protein
MPQGLPTALPYGIRDIKVTAYTDAAATTLATPTVDLPYARTLSWTESEDFEELRGDDTIITTKGKGPEVEWELEAGGLHFDALKIIDGGTITETGTTPAKKLVYKKLATDSKPFFKIEGQVISDSGGDVHLVMDRCRASGDFEGEFTDGEFFLTACSGVALGSQIATRLGIIYEFTQNETAVALT